MSGASGVIRGNQRLLFAALITLLAAAITPAVASATTFYVSPSGSDSNSGSPSRPWRSVYRVDNARLRPGDQVLFQGGASFGDDTLMPGGGLRVSGTSRAPVVFGSYGQGRATLPQGIWIKGERHLIFQDLNLGPEAAVTGTGDDDMVQYCAMTDLMGRFNIAVNVIGERWVIRDNLIDHTGDSGMLLRGGHFLVAGNTITNTGLDPAITYGSHGIYLKAPNSTVTGNTIAHFRDNGVSVRYRNSIVTDNTIVGGKFGIAYFQGDTRSGHTRFIGNIINDTTIAGIYVSPYGIGGPTHENIAIRRNRIYRPSHGIRAAATSTWEAIALSRNRRRYRVRGNAVL